MKKTTLFAYLTCLIYSTVFSNGYGQHPAVAPAGIPADEINVRYGTHDRNVFDLWLADSNEPTPLVIFIHGGGFVSGDKSKAYERDEIDFFLDKGISYATINCRYMTGEPLGVRASLYDSQRALQYIRSRAKEWNIDKDRIACYGGSAGAGTSLWLAFHDDMADPANEDPVLRESTRALAAAALSTQATYNLARWNEVFDIPVMAEDSSGVWRFYGFNAREEIHTPEGQAVIAACKSSQGSRRGGRGSCDGICSRNWH